MVKINAAGTEPQDAQMHYCLKMGPTEIWSLCFVCGHGVVGVTITDKPGQYSIECKVCGYSAEAYHDLNAFRRLEEGS